ncbi:MAG: hypothetical protein ACOC56_00895 [Atribacterota bacterium]
MNILDKINKILNEDFVSSDISPAGLYTEIFKNPSKKEILTANKSGTMRGVVNGIRFILDCKDKNLFVWNAGYFHNKAIDRIKKQGLLKEYHSFYLKDKNVDYMKGIGEYKNGKIYVINIIDAYEIIRKNIENNEDIYMKWKWAFKYFTNLDKFTVDLGKHIKDVEF